MGQTHGGCDRVTRAVEIFGAGYYRFATVAAQAALDAWGARARPPLTWPGRESTGDCTGAATPPGSSSSRTTGGWPESPANRIAPPIRCRTMRGTGRECRGRRAGPSSRTRGLAGSRRELAHAGLEVASRRVWCRRLGVDAARRGRSRSFDRRGRSPSRRTSGATSVTTRPTQAPAIPPPPDRRR